MQRPCFICIKCCDIDLKILLKEVNEKAELLRVSEGKSKREVKAIVLNHLPIEKRNGTATVAVKREAVPSPRPIFAESSSKETPKTEERYTIKLEVDSSFMKLFNEAKSLSNEPAEELFRRALNCYLDKRSPLRRIKRRETRKESGAVQSKNPRNIPIKDRDNVYLNDSGRCSFVSALGVHCSSTHSLEIDHIRPIGKGGSSDPGNLRLLCKAHNQHAAELQFGKEHMRQFLS